MILLPLGNNSLNISNANVIADFDDVDRKQVNVSSLKCNNININVNGLELYVTSTISRREVAATATDGETGTDSFANNRDDSQINDFRFICINNNNNTVIGIANGGAPTPTPEDDCEECFAQVLSGTQFATLEETLEEEVVIVVIVPLQVQINSLQEL